MEQLKFKGKCQKHFDEKITYMRINNSPEMQSKPFFLCQECINSQKQFNVEDYIWIKDIINKGNKQILSNWPFINNSDILAKLMVIANQPGNNSNNNNSLIEQVYQFFKDFKRLVLEQIDICQKNMIQIAEKIQTSNNQGAVLKEYQTITKITELSDQLLKKDSTIEQKETICKQLVISSQYQNITELLSNLVYKYTQKTTFNPQPALILQKSILDSINQIQLFQQLNPPYQSISDFALLNTNFKDGLNNQKITINHNQQYQVQLIKEDYIYNTVSNIILQPNKKYMFRVKIDSLLENQKFLLGLIQSKNVDSTGGFCDYLSCLLQNRGGQICKHNDNCGIYSQLKGQNQFVLSDEREMELRVSIADKILHVFDYPRYNYQLALDNQYMDKLVNGQQFRLYIGLLSLNNSVTVTDARIVDSFEP